MPQKWFYLFPITRYRITNYIRNNGFCIRKYNSIVCKWVPCVSLIRSLNKLLLLFLCWISCHIIWVACPVRLPSTAALDNVLCRYWVQNRKVVQNNNISNTCPALEIHVKGKQKICIVLGTDHPLRQYKVVQIWPGLFVCKQVTVYPGHIWTTLYFV
jgi:hypothetical protein